MIIFPGKRRDILKEGRHIGPLDFLVENMTSHQYMELGHLHAKVIERVDHAWASWVRN